MPIPVPDKVGKHLTGEAVEVMRTVAMKVLSMYHDETVGRAKMVKAGLYCSIYTLDDAVDKTPLVTFRCGVMHRDLKATFRHHCQEQACRLGEHLVDGHVSSFQSADFKSTHVGGTWPGAILANLFILSCASGMPWEYNEVASLATGMELGLINLSEAAAIGAVSKNGVFPRFVDFEVPAPPAPLIG